jgi:putative ABC transport system substrate-binding protein
MNPDDSGAQSSWDATQAAAKSLGLQIIALDIRVPSDFDKLTQAATRSRIDAILVLRGGIAYFLRKQIAALAQQHKLPGIYYAAEFVEAGGLMSYASNNEAQYRRAAYYVDKILKGAKPGDLPIEQPTKFEFVINLKTVKQIGLTIPPNVLARVDRVIR